MDDTRRRRLSCAYIHIFPVFLFLSLEIQNMSQIMSDVPALVISCVLIYLTLLFLYSTTGSVFASGFSIALTLLTFYTISFYRRMQTGQVLIPPDLYFAKHIKSVAAFTNLTLDWRVVLSVFLVILLLAPLFYISRATRLKGRPRFALLAVSGAALFFLFFTKYSREKILPMFSVDVSAKGDINRLYEEQGALMGFYTVGFTEASEMPEGYGKEYMDSLVAAVADKAGDTADGLQPDVIIIMSEAFSDINRMPNIAFSEDPTPNLTRLRAASGVAAGYTLAPVFGGLTCNTEYELLSGNSMKYVGYGEIPYYNEETYIDTDRGRSLVGMFKKNGYRTVALHTHTGSFYDRDQLYPKLGFDEFISAEDMPDAIHKGTLHNQALIADSYFADKVVEIMENAEAPLFLFGITVENHTPYLQDKFENNHIRVDSELLTEEELTSVESYAEGLYDADAVLGRLYDYVMANDRPTIVVYFGDHLPFFTYNTGVYDALGYIEGSDMAGLSTEDSYKMYTTPYVAFSNYMPMESWGEVSPYFLGALTADAAGIDKNLYYSFLMQAFERFQAMNDRISIADGVVFEKLDECDIMEMFKAFQYDKLFGDDYAGTAMSSLLGELSATVEP